MTREYATSTSATATSEPTTAIPSHQISSPTVQATIDTGRPNACNLCHLDKTLEWSAEHLFEWYGTPKPDLNDDDRTIAAWENQLRRLNWESRQAQKNL